MPSLKALGPRSRGPVAFPDLYSLLDSEGGRGGPPAGRSAWQEAQGPGSGERLKWLPLACRVTVAVGRSTSWGLCSLRSARAQSQGRFRSQRLADCMTSKQPSFGASLLSLITWGSSLRLLGGRRAAGAP